MLTKINTLFKRKDFKYMIQNNAIIIDVRSPREFEQGAIKSSTNLPLERLNSNLEDLKHKNVPIILCCASGMRSANGTSILKAAGIEAYNGGTWTALKKRI